MIYLVARSSSIVLVTGTNTIGQLGILGISQNEFVENPYLSETIQISSGYDHVLALLGTT